MRRIRWLLVPLALAACNSGSGSSDGNAGSAFTKSLQLQVPNSPVVGDLPAGNAPAGGPEVVDLGSPALTLSPGDPVSVSVPYSGGEIAAVNVGFGGGSYFSVPVPNAAGKSQGVVQIPASLGSDVCGGLANICHQIKCYEQVVLPDGTVSNATAQQIVLNCTGGKDCNGNKVPDGLCPPLGDCSTCMATSCDAGEDTFEWNFSSFCCWKDCLVTGANCNAEKQACFGSDDLKDLYEISSKPLVKCMFANCQAACLQPSAWKK